MIYLFVDILRDSRNSNPKCSHALTQVESGCLFKLLVILLFALKMGEMKSVYPIRLELQETRSNNAVVKIDYLAANVARLLEELAIVLGKDEAHALGELAMIALATISNGSKKHQKCND